MDDDPLTTADYPLPAADYPLPAADYPLSATGFLHLALLGSEILARIPPLSVSPALAGIAAIGAWPWGQPSLQAAVGLCLGAAILGDGVSLALLPRKGRSFGPVTPPLLALALLRAALAFGLGALSPTVAGAVLTVILQAGITALHLYATWVEPFRLTVTSLEIPSPKLQSGESLRVLHLSDIHFEGWTPRERQLLETVRALAPDLIFLTGDYLNLSSVDDGPARQGVRDLLAQLAAVAPTWAVIGSPPVDRPDVVPQIFAGLPITWLVDDVAEVAVKGHSFRLIGVRCTADHRRDGERLRRLLESVSSHLTPDGAKEGGAGKFQILLYHSPDLFPVAAELGIDLHLAGHTHGGQLRLPLFGALVTSSAFWKRYEAGLYRHSRSTLYVSRGIGVEGKGAPRARFLAPPEIVLLELGGICTPS
ncbi:MAG: metallophosphoesterase [Thermoflexales bacterium]|nr:metallophosphoesterase [Thermoflexales bacterium]